MRKIKLHYAVLMTLVLLLTFSFGLVPVQAANIRLNKSKATIYVGNTMQLKLSGAKGTVKWSSSNASIASVSTKGLVTGKKNGKATITATVGDTKYSSIITVKKGTINYSEFYDAHTTGVWNINSLFKISNLKDSSKIEWSSSNKAVATIEKGVYEGDDLDDIVWLNVHSIGTTTLYAKVENVTYKVKYHVIPEIDDSVFAFPIEQEINGTSYSYYTDVVYDYISDYLAGNSIDDYISLIYYSNEAKDSHYEMYGGIDVGSSKKDVEKVYGSFGESWKITSDQILTSDIYGKSSYYLRYSYFIDMDDVKLPYWIKSLSLNVYRSVYFDENDIVTCILTYPEANMIDEYGNYDLIPIIIT